MKGNNAMTDRTNHCTGCKERQGRIEALTAENERLRGALERIKQITSRSDNDYTVCPDCMDIETETRAALKAEQ